MTIGELLGAVALACLTALAAFCLARCIAGPRVSDRIMSVNMINTLCIIMVDLLAVIMGKGYLADIALIYSLLGFLAVVVLCKVYIGVYREKKAGSPEEPEGGGDA